MNRSLLWRLAFLPLAGMSKGFEPKPFGAGFGPPGGGFGPPPGGGFGPAKKDR